MAPLVLSISLLAQFPPPAARSDVPDAQPNGPISIVAIQLSENPMRAGDAVTGTVITTDNVAAVTAQAGSFRISLPKIAPGRFRTTITVPRLMLWAWRGDVVVTAIRTDGTKLERDVPIEVDW